MGTLYVTITFHRLKADKKGAPMKLEDSTNKVVADARREMESRANSYRERALKLFPWICGSCGREFSGKKLQELTVHHKDHDHDNNPADGSNWELLCLYCHDNEHDRQQVANAYSTDPSRKSSGGPNAMFQPFANLDSLLKGKK